MAAAGARLRGPPHDLASYLDGVVDNPTVRAVTSRFVRLNPPSSLRRRPQYASKTTVAAYRGEMVDASRAISNGVMNRSSSRSIRGSGVRRQGDCTIRLASTALCMTFDSVW